MDRSEKSQVSDLWRPSVLERDHETILILAGDIWNGTRPIKFAEEKKGWLGRQSMRFKAVVIVFGNHDYWGENVNSLAGKWRNTLAVDRHRNVHVLELADGVEEGSVVIDGVRILGGTLWTDMHKGDPLVRSKFDHEKGIDGKAAWNDQNFIRAYGYSRFMSEQWLEKHNQTMVNLKEALTVGDEDVMLLTHHSPCLKSAPPRDGDPLSSYLYGSDLSDLILDNPRIKHVIHGHVHEPFDYMLGQARVRCNPRGYAPGGLVKGFDHKGFSYFSSEDEASDVFIMR